MPIQQISESYLEMNNPPEAEKDLLLKESRKGNTTIGSAGLLWMELKNIRQTESDHYRKTGTTLKQSIKANSDEMHLAQALAPLQGDNPNKLITPSRVNFAIGALYSGDQ